jgi:hypothetical protein
MSAVDIYGRPVTPLTHEEQLDCVRSLAAHNLTTAIAKHRRAVDKAIIELKNALNALGKDGETPYLEVAQHRINYAIRDLLKSKRYPKTTPQANGDEIPLPPRLRSHHPALCLVRYLRSC